MRPEYLEAVESAKYGALLVLTVAVPVAIIFVAFLANRFVVKGLDTPRRTLVLFGATSVAYLAFLLLAVYYADGVEHAKMEMAVTDLEFSDSTADNPFGLLLIFPAGLVLCGFAFLVGVIATGLSRIQMNGSSSVAGAVIVEDEQPDSLLDNPYASR